MKHIALLLLLFLILLYINRFYKNENFIFLLSSGNKLPIQKEKSIPKPISPKSIQKPIPKPISPKPIPKKIIQKKNINLHPYNSDTPNIYTLHNYSSIDGSDITQL